MSTRSTIMGAARLAALAVVLLASLAHAAQYGHRPAPIDGAGMSTVRGATLGFKISGHVKSLYPGKTTKLVTTVRNSNRVPIRVTRIGAKVAGIAGCPARFIKIKPFHGNRYVGSGHTATIKLQSRMRPKAPNGCQGAKVHLTYHGRAVQA